MTHRQSGLNTMVKAENAKGHLRVEVEMNEPQTTNVN